MTISVPRTTFLCALFGLCFGTATVALASSTPCANLTSTVSPTTASVGQAVTLSGQVTNCSTSSEKITVVSTVVDPNGVSDTYSYSFTLKPGQSHSDSSSLAAPSTVGVYTVDVTVFSGSTKVAANTQTVTVQ